MKWLIPPLWLFPKVSEIFTTRFLFTAESAWEKPTFFQAIGNETRKNNPAAKVQYLTSEKFANDYVLSIQK